MFKNIPNIFSKKVLCKKAEKNSASFYKFKNPHFFYPEQNIDQKTISRYRPCYSAATA
jgi:hypothetical protein